MSRIPGCFEALRRVQRKALIPFITAGDPHPRATVPLMHTLVEAGADIIELGVPFSDPMADGPIIQRSSERALKHCVSLRTVLAMVAEFRLTDATTPVVLMGYLNPVEVMGYGQFAEAAASAGVDGVLTVDLPPEEADEFTSVLCARQIDAVFLFAPTTNDDRAARICSAAGGFIYYVSLKGVTGANTLNIGDVAARLQRIRRHTSLPIGVGFGVKDAVAAAQVASIADAVVVGSALVATMENSGQDITGLSNSARRFLSDLRTAMDAVPGNS
ncbi:MAG: tryptophan synthase subunit alpha [Chromatiales bacterium]